MRSRPRLAKLQDNPVAESVVTGAELGRDVARDFNAITKRLPGITFNQSNARGANLSIRGLGKRGFAEFQDPSVLTIVDDISFGLTQLGNFDFYDVDQVSVLRGPTGTDGGKGGSAGQIVFTSKQPTFVPQSDYSVTYGQNQTLVATAGFGGPIVDDLLAWRGAITVNKGQGYYKNASNDRGNYTQYNTDRVAGRTQFLLTPTPNLKVNFTYELEPKTSQLQNGLSENLETPLYYAGGSLVSYNKRKSLLTGQDVFEQLLVDKQGTTARSILQGFNNGTTTTAPREWFQGRGFGYSDWLNSTTNNGSVNFDQTQGQTVQYRGNSLKADYKLPNNDTVSSITGFRSYSFDARNDEGTPYDIAKYGGGGVYYHQISQEVRLRSETDKPFEYTAGLYFIGTRDQVESHSGYGADGGAWYATNAQYNALYPAANNTAATAALRNSGKSLLLDSVNGLYTKSDTTTSTKSTSVYGETKWKFDEKLALNSGLRLTWDSRDQLFTQSTPNYGAGALLNYETQKAFNGAGVRVNVPTLGGFDTYAADVKTPNPAAPNDANQDTLTHASGDLKSTSTAALNAADAVAFKYFGAARGANPGDAYNSLSAAQKKQVAFAQAIRSAKVGASNYDGTPSHTSGLLATTNISPTYKINDEVTSYFAWQYGEKAGTPNISNGQDTPVKPERTQAFELGFKSNLLEKTLVLNANLFLMNIRDYQQTVRVIDPVATAEDQLTNPGNAPVTVNTQGNVAKIQSKGFELNAIYSGVKNFNFSGGFTYNDARYKDFKNAAIPVELTYLTSAKDPLLYYDATGHQVAGAPKYHLTFGAEYRVPVFDNQSFHASFNTDAISSYYNDEALSSYSVIPKHAVTDITVGLGNLKKNFDVSVTVKNAFDDKTHEQGWTSYEPTPYRRWVGVTLSGQL